MVDKFDHERCNDELSYFITVHKHDVTYKNFAGCQLYSLLPQVGYITILYK